jgi:dihydroxyacid dehydratase/phosphogluconate dehydratase
LDVSEETLNKRRAENKLKPEQELSGYLKRYAKMVGSADTGASFKY